MSTRTFEFVEGTSSKFWEIWIAGNAVHTRYGRIGSNGQTTVKDEGSEAAARKLHDKLVAEKTRKGYVEKVPAAESAKLPPAAPPKPAPAAPPKPAPAEPARKPKPWNGPLPLNEGEVWSDAALEAIRALPDDRRMYWWAFLDHCGRADGGQPSAKWLDATRMALDLVGRDELAARLLEWFPLVDRPRTAPLPERLWTQDPMRLDDENAGVLKGLAWCTAPFERPDLARAVAALALSAYKKVPGLGPRGTKVGNACVWALGQMPGDTPLAALAGLKVRVKFGTAQIGIEKALQEVANRAGISREELDELGVPAYGLEEVGLRREELGAFRAELRVDGTEARISWFDAGGKPQKSVPKAVKTDHADDFKELTQAGKDIGQMLLAQRDRMDGLALLDKRWPFEVWRARYLDHPLVGTLARRLVWFFQRGSERAAAIHVDGAFVDAAGAVVPLAAEGAEVTPWHPIEADQGQILAWRNFVEAREIQQPFKQVHREVYLLTDAERRTDTYSNRFASHILKQHQFNALTAARGWRNKLRLMVDDTYPPATRELPQLGLRAEFWVEGVGADYGTDTNEAGVYNYLATDQVRFYAIDAAENFAHAGGGGYTRAYGVEPGAPLALGNLPRLVFSEIMRDVDLFVGVTSVGNDANWSDGGPQGRYVDYWHSYSFGELGATAQTRKLILEKLVPRLKIRDRCRFDDRFLVVRGDVRTYKIHLGSSNIMMEPNDQYLCIVPAQVGKTTAEAVHLPFDGDARLSVILSKAFLLADDRNIKDPSIVSQIGR